MNVAQKCRLEKEDKGANFCPSPKCLWKTGGGYCPRHKPAMSKAELAAEAKAYDDASHGDEFEYNMDKV